MGEDIYFYSATDDLLAEIVAGRLRAVGHAVELGPETAMRESLLSGAFSVAVFDAQLSDALALLAKLKERAAQTRVVLLLPEEAAKPSGLRIDGEAVLVEPFEVTALNVALDAQLAAVAADPSVQTVSLAFATTDENVETARIMLEERLSGVGVLDEEQRFHLLTAFGEAIGNAALHGNKARRDRVVRLRFEHAQEYVSLTVTDEGQGFDWRNNEVQAAEANGSTALAQAAAREAQGKLGGLGLNLMRQVCDAVEFNPAGNEITLRKSLPVQPRAV